MSAKTSQTVSDVHIMTPNLPKAGKAKAKPRSWTEWRIQSKINGNVGRDIFKSREEARQNLLWPPQMKDKFRIVRVRVTVTEIPRRK